MGRKATKSLGTFPFRRRMADILKRKMSIQKNVPLSNCLLLMLAYDTPDKLGLFAVVADILIRIKVRREKWNHFFCLHSPSSVWKPLIIRQKRNPQNKNCIVRVCASVCVWVCVRERENKRHVFLFCCKCGLGLPKVCVDTLFISMLVAVSFFRYRETPQNHTHTWTYTHTHTYKRILSYGRA